MRVTLLGTGCPIVDVHRYGPATLIEQGAETWLVDCGSGVSQRLLAHGTHGARLTGILLTHLHSDHLVDLIQVLISGWHQGRTTPLRVYGPGGTRTFLGQVLEAWQPEFRQRSVYELRPAAGLEVNVEEIADGWELKTEAGHIRAVEVRHQPVPQSFGFRFDTQDGAAVISGDTAYSPELIAQARGCDVLVHETFVHWAFEEQRRAADARMRANVRAYHTPSGEVGRVAAEAGARNLVLTHFVPTVFDRDRVARDVRAHYGGGLFIGEDLMSLDITQDGVSLLRGGGMTHP